jgi:hypothetical protein
VQVTLVVIDHEIISTAIHTLPLLFVCTEVSVPCKSEGIYCSTGKLLDSLPRNDAVAELTMLK